MQKGKIDVKTENIFPIIKKFLYSEHEIFLRELISNAVDATQKLRTLASLGEYKEELGDVTIRVALDKKKKTLRVSDYGIGMTGEEVKKYINQVAFSSAEEFLEKYKNKEQAIIGHFGLGFYSTFMVSDKVEIITKSYKKGTKPVKWTCDGSPEYTLEDANRERVGTDVILHLDKNSGEFLDEARIESILKRYSRFLPVEIAFGKKKEWKDGKEVETKEDNIINDTEPLWTKQPANVKDEEYKQFYSELYPAQEDPLFNIHLNVDYPFNLTGILYFPKIKSNFEIQKNKIQLYCNQVFVTDSVEGIVPEFLTLLHGVLDSPDIPLNVSRSYLQGDPNVKKISAHISKKVADRLEELFKADRKDFEKKWDDISLFIKYGMITEEKFYDRAESYALLKNTDGKKFTFDEYEKLIKLNQTDKDKTLIYLYATNKEEQYSYIDAARSRGYDVLLMDGELDTHFINHLEQKFKDSRFVRVDADVIDKLIRKEDVKESGLSPDQKEAITAILKSRLPGDKFMVSYEDLGENEQPILITQSEFMRRMKDMSQLSPGMGMYGNLPETYNLVVNSAHPLIKRILDDQEKSVGDKVRKVEGELKPLQDEKDRLAKEQEKKKDEEIAQEEKDKLEELNKKTEMLSANKEKYWTDYGKKNDLVKQLVDLALLANNMLKGEELSTFVKRSVELIK